MGGMELFKYFPPSSNIKFQLIADDSEPFRQARNRTIGIHECNVESGNTRGPEIRCSTTVEVRQPC